MSGSLTGYSWFCPSISRLNHRSGKQCLTGKTTRKSRLASVCQQMEAELEGCQLVKVEGNKLYVKQDNQDLAFGLSNASDF